MPRINAGQEFGRMAPRVGAEVVDAGPGPQTLGQIGQRMERQGLQAEAQAQAEVRRQQQELQQQRDAADRARASSVLANTRDRIADTAAQIDQEIQDGRLPKTDALTSYKERTAELVASSVGEVPDAHRGIVQQDLQGYAGRFDSRVTDAVRRRDQADTRADLDSTLEALQRSAVGNYDQARTQALAALDSLGPAAGLRPDQVGKAKQAWIESAAYTRAFSAVQSARQDNRALSAVEQRVAADADLDPQRRAQLLAQVEGFRAHNEARALRPAQAAEIAAARQEREASRAWDVLSGWALAGKAADPEANAALIAKLDPARLAAYKALAAEIPARTAAAMLPLDQQQAQLDALIAQRATRGTSPELEKEIERREKVLTEARKDYEADPLRAGAQRGIIDRIAPLDTSSFDGIAQSLAGRIEQAQAVATRTRQPVSPFLPEEAARVGDMLGALAPSAQGRMIAQLAQVMPQGQMAALAKQLDGKDRALALQMAAGAAKTTEGRTVAELIGRGRQAIKDKSVKEDSAAESGLRASLVKEIGDALTGRNREDVIDAARLIYLGKQAEGSRISPEGAVRLAVGGDLVEHQGRKVPVPAGVDLPQALRRVPEASISSQTKDGMVYLAGGRPMGVPEFLAGLPSAQLEAVAPGRYVVRSGGSLVVNDQRRPIVVGVTQ